ncbi:hypothetical protein P7L88_06120 [Bisgaard Taxon 10/6]|uniref:ApeA N-terminal domain-containing protein n=1 Tax=Exercitatus varius TaxID=67857 RepID=A0AAW6QAV6_9PAST|nr:HEPN domain-containing protein [Exercitatus varius]MDG2948105.1 hypothetical protein [Exercitatus varius]MDG2949596.1 hypothetical protein [Exercitatus varius]
MKIEKNLEYKGKFKILTSEQDFEVLNGSISFDDSNKNKITLWVDDVRSFPLKLGECFNLISDLSNLKNCILLNCFITSIPSYGSGEVHIVANKVIFDLDSDILGSVLSYLKNSEIYFDGIRFRFDNIDVWANSTKIFEVLNNREENTLEIKCKMRDSILLYENDNVIIQVIFMYNFPGFPIIKNATISESSYIEIICREGSSRMTIDELLEYTYYVHSFLDFTIGSLSLINDVFMLFRDDKNKIHKSKYIIPSASLGKKDQTLKWLDVNIPLDSLVSDNKLIYLENWINHFEKIRPSIELYRNYKLAGNNSTESKFLWLAQSVEALHRRTCLGTEISENEYEIMKAELKKYCPPNYLKWLENKLKYGNEISFKKRVNEFIDPVWEVLNTKLNNYEANPQFCSNLKKRCKSDIVKYRNEFTHYDPKHPKITIDIALRIITLTTLLEFVLIYQVYLFIGLKKEDILNLLSFGHNKIGRLLVNLKYQIKRYL